MRKELFDHEITILRDTFRRLLRRKANTNLIKLIKKTHPADLAIIFRYFLDEEQEYVFSIMKESEQTTEFLVELDDTILQKLLKDEEPERISVLLDRAPINNQSYIIGNLENEKAQSVINLLKLEEKKEIEELMGYPDDSAGTMMTTDIFTIDQNTTCGDALKKLQDHNEAEMVFYLYLTDEEKRLTGVASLRALATSSVDTIMRNIMIKKIHSLL